VLLLRDVTYVELFGDISELKLKIFFMFLFSVLLKSETIEFELRLDPKILLFEIKIDFLLSLAHNAPCRNAQSWYLSCGYLIQI